MSSTLGIVDVKKIVKSIYDNYSIDLTDYNLTLLRQRFTNVLDSLNYNNVEHLIQDIETKKVSKEKVLDKFLLNETELFRDASFWRDMRDVFIPELAKKSNPIIWMPGILSGEELFTMAILLKEMGLQDKIRIKASCDCKCRMQTIKAGGTYPIKEIDISTSNYTSFGGLGSFSDYCINEPLSIHMDVDLIKNVEFELFMISQEITQEKFDMIIFRNLLIQYTLPLYEKVVGRMIDSIDVGSYLIIGSKETLAHTELNKKMETASVTEKIYRKRSN